MIFFSSSSPNLVIMETLSTSVSTLKLHTLPSTTPRELNLFKPSHSTHHLPHLHNKSTNPISNRPSPSSFSNKSLFTSFHHSTSTSLPKAVTTTPSVHTKATTGYAAALVDVSRRDNTITSVGKDVRRLSKMLRNEDLRAVLIDPCIGETTKCQVVKEIVEKGRFQKHLVALLKMVIEKKGIGMVSEVLAEFERIYDELNGTQVVFVSSKKKLEEGQLLGIAKKVQKMSGAVNVKVKNLIRETSLTLAV